MLDLEIAGPVRELSADEVEVVNPPAPKLAKLKDSHHMVARLMTRGLSDTEISVLTGYTLPRLAVLKRDPTFAELLNHYRRTNEDVAIDIEARLRAMAIDGMQEMQERLLDDPGSIDFDTLGNHVTKWLDRAGYAPVQRTINKNLNLNFGERLDKANGR